MFICILIAADAFLILLLISSLQILEKPVYAKESQHITENSRDLVSVLGKNIKNSTQAISSTISGTATNIGSTINATARTISDTTSTVIGDIATTVTQPETIIKPEPSYKTPEIEPVAQPVAITTPPAQTPPQPSAPPVAPTATPQPVQSAVWPVRGTVTTEFGVYHQPFQARHTGMDIASGQPIGRAAITPFREGVVIEAARSARGLGNYIVIDHGNGLTSWYGHLSSITVNKGQTVRPGDTIGYEGRTGVATGAHLHLEIRENGNPVNPRKYIAN